MWNGIIPFDESSRHITDNHITSSINKPKAHASSPPKFNLWIRFFVLLCLNEASSTDSLDRLFFSSIQFNSYHFMFFNFLFPSNRYLFIYKFILKVYFGMRRYNLYWMSDKCQQLRVIMRHKTAFYAVKLSKKSWKFEQNQAEKTAMKTKIRVKIIMKANESLFIYYRSLFQYSVLFLSFLFSVIVALLS